MKYDFIINCIQCNKQFKVERYRLGKQKFCSRKCYWDSKKVSLKCSFCEKIFKRLKHLINKNSLEYFCSKKCQSKRYKQNLVWNRQDNSNVLGSERILQIKKGKACTICGSYLDLEIHHIDKDRRNNSVENLQVLCKKCHLKIHHKKYIPKNHLIYYVIQDPMLKPERKHITDVGIDLKASKDYIIEVGKFVDVDCGIKVEIPTGCYGLLALRSGLAREGLLMHYGIIDSSYRGYISGFIHNFGNKPYRIKKGDRVCQLIVQEYRYLELEEVKELSTSERGENGFGSSGR